MNDKYEMPVVTYTDQLTGGNALVDARTVNNDGERCTLPATSRTVLLGSTLVNRPWITSWLLGKHVEKHAKSVSLPDPSGSSETAKSTSPMASLLVQ
jgi:hypothetical protein